MYDLVPLDAACGRNTGALGGVPARGTVGVPAHTSQAVGWLGGCPHHQFVSLHKLSGPRERLLHGVSKDTQSTLMASSPAERVGCCLQEGREQPRGVPRGWGAAASVPLSACILLPVTWRWGPARQQAADGRAEGFLLVSAALCQSHRARRCLSPAAQRRPRREPVLPGAACQHLADRHRIVCRGKYACPCLPPPRRGMRWQHFKARRVAG